MDICAGLQCETSTLVETTLHIFLQLKNNPATEEDEEELEEEDDDEGQEEEDEGEHQVADCESVVAAGAGRRAGSAAPVSGGARASAVTRGPSPHSRVRWHQQQPHQRGSPINMSSNASRAKLAYAIMEALARQNTPMSPKDIAYRCDVDPKAILAIENKCCTAAGYSCPSQYVERACSFLDLPYYVGKLAQELCHRVQEDFYGFTPESLVCACIWSIVMGIRREEKNPYLFGTIQLSDMCRVLSTPKRSVKTGLERLPNFELKAKFHGLGDSGSITESRCNYVLTNIGGGGSASTPPNKRGRFCRG